MATSGTFGAEQRRASLLSALEREGAVELERAAADLGRVISGESATASATYRPLSKFSLADDFIASVRADAWTPEFKELIRYYSGLASLGTGDSKERPRHG